MKTNKKFTILNILGFTNPNEEGTMYKTLFTRFNDNNTCNVHNVYSDINISQKVKLKEQKPPDIQAGHYIKAEYVNFFHDMYRSRILNSYSNVFQ